MTWDWGYFFESLQQIVTQGLRVTLELTLLGTAVAMVLGLILAMLRRITLRVVRYPLNFVVEFIQTTPLLVQALFAYYGVAQYFGLRVGWFGTAVIVLGIHYATYTSEVYRAGIEAVPGGQWQAARALNFSRGDTWRRVVLPQAVPPVMPALGNYLISMFKDVPQLLVIGVVDMAGTAEAISSQTYKAFEPFIAVGIIYVLLAYPSSLVVRRLEARYGQLV